MDADRIKAIIAENMEVARKGSFRKREAYAQAAGMLGVKHILSLTGIRRCGKSTLMKELVRAALKKFGLKEGFIVTRDRKESFEKDGFPLK